MPTYKKTVLERVEFHPPKINKPDLPLVVDDWTLSFRLGFTGRAFWYIVNNRDQLYREFKIKKASGGLRLIHNPSKIMRVMSKQIRSRILLPLCADLGPHVAAYQIGKSTRDAVKQHMFNCPTCEQHETPHTCQYALVMGEASGYKILKLEQEACNACKQIPKHDCPRRGVKIHMDLKDFFLSTRRAWIRKYFHEVVGYNHYVSSLLATLLTVKWKDRKKRERQGVPQGSTTSGDICNLVADWRLDKPILAYLKGWRYTRYADDLYFSHPQNLSKEEVNKTIADIERIIQTAGYRANRKKLRVQRPGGRQSLLGIVLNQRPNIPREEYRKFRALLFNCIRNGFDAEAEKAGKENGQRLQAWVSGKLAYFQMVAPHKAIRLKLMFDHARQKHVLKDDFEDAFVYEKKESA